MLGKHVVARSLSLLIVVGVSLLLAVAIADSASADGVLTANFVLVPSDHDGSAFTVQLHFSEPIGNKPRHVKEAFSQPRMVGQPAAGGSVTKAKRLDRAWVSGKRVTSQWELTVEPSGSGDVELRAAGNLVCSGGSALCTHPGRQSLSHDLSATIRDGTASGQGSRPGQTSPPGRVVDLRAELCRTLRRRLHHLL